MADKIVDFLPVATAVGANVESQADYDADASRTDGNQSGLANSALANKMWRQASMMTAAIANLISQRANVDVLDDGDLDALIALCGLIMPRYALTDDMTLYVSGTGDNDNDGLTALTPFLTRQYAYDWAQKHLDLQGHTLTFQQAAGTTTDLLSAAGPLVGQGGSDTVIFLGDANTPANVIVNAAGSIFASAGGSRFKVKGFQLTSSAGNCLVASGTGSVIEFDRINFGTSNTHIGAGDKGQAKATNAAAYAIVGNGNTHMNASFGGLVNTNNATVTISNNPNFVDQFALAQYGAVVEAGAVTYTGAGTVTGVRYQAVGNGVLYTNGGGANYFPGNAPGVTSSGGQYV